MHRRLRIAAALCLLAVGPLASLADGHFLFIRISEHAEAGRAAEVFFSEQARAGDPRFTAKVAHTRLWVQSEPGKFQPLAVRAAADRLRAFVPATGCVAIVGECEYGVLKRDVSFLLRYYPKAIAGPPEELARLRPRPETPVEIVATVAGDAVQLVALRQGQPIPRATFTTIDNDLANDEVQADDRGVAVWKPAAPGQYAVYTKVVTPTAGELGGQSYSEIREFATLAFAWPLGATQPQPEAVAMFERAISARATWRDFPGFTANIAGVVDGRSFTGKVKVAANGEVQLELDDDAVQDWVEEQVNSIVTHRQASGGRAQPVLRFADDDDTHPLGRLLAFYGGRFASSYRIRGDEIMVVNRHLGDENMSITMLLNDRNAEGKLLPRAYTVQYWDAASGALKRTEVFQNRWVRVGGLDLPEGLTFWSSSDAGLAVREFRLSSHALWGTN